jgi:hypothetical protein
MFFTCYVEFSVLLSSDSRNNSDPSLLWKDSIIAALYNLFMLCMPEISSSVTTRLACRECKRITKTFHSCHFSSKSCSVSQRPPLQGGGTCQSRVGRPYIWPHRILVSWVLPLIATIKQCSRSCSTLNVFLLLPMCKGHAPPPSLPSRCSKRKQHRKTHSLSYLRFGSFPIQQKMTQVLWGCESSTIRDIISDFSKSSSFNFSHLTFGILKIYDASQASCCFQSFSSYCHSFKHL